MNIVNDLQTVLTERRSFTVENRSSIGANRIYFLSTDDPRALTASDPSL